MYQVYRQTLGNKPLIFGGGSTNTSDSESLDGVEFVNGTRPGNPELVELAKRQVGNVGGQPYWSWYGFNSRVEWCACFVSWCYGQMGYPSRALPPASPRASRGSSPMDNGARAAMTTSPPGDAIFFDWDLDGRADHVGIVIGYGRQPGLYRRGKQRRRLQNQKLRCELRVHQGLRPDELVTNLLIRSD